MYKTYNTQFVRKILLLSMLVACNIINVTAAPSTASDPLDQIVVVVNDSIITEKQIAERIEWIKQQSAGNQSIGLTEEIKLREEVIQEMIKMELELQMIRRRGIPEEEIDHMVDQVAQENGITLNSQREREQLKQELLLQQFRTAIIMQSKLEVTDEEIQEQMKSLPMTTEKTAPIKYHVEDLLIPLPDSKGSTKATSAWKKWFSLKVFGFFTKKPPAEDIKDTQSTIQNVLAKAKQGASFKELVFKYEKRRLPGRRNLGKVYTARYHNKGMEKWEVSDLGWRTADQFPAFYWEAIKHLNPGEVAGPLEAPNGMHLIRLLAKQGATQHYITHVRHILLNTTPQRDEEAVKRQLQDIRQACFKSKNFQEQAKQYSEDPTSVFEGGDLGWVLPGALGPDFDKHIAQLIPGAISQPFKTPRGWHIVQIVAREALTPDHPQWKKHLARMAVQQRKEMNAIEEWRKTLHAQAYIKRADLGDSLNTVNK